MLKGNWFSEVNFTFISSVSSVQSLSRVPLFVTPWIAARQASLSITNSWSSLRLASIESVMPSSHLILGRPLLLLPPIPPIIKVFSNESTGMEGQWYFAFIALTVLRFLFYLHFNKIRNERRLKQCLFHHFVVFVIPFELHIWKLSIFLP